MPRYEFFGKRPQVAPSAYVHREAVLIGDVVIEDGCYIAAGAVLRGDMGKITVRAGSTFQDNSVAHGEVTIGPNTLITHRCVIHFAKIGERVLVGIGSVVMDGAEVGDGCVIGAGSLLVPNFQVPPGKMVMGSPAKIARETSAADAEMITSGLATYQHLPSLCFEGLREIQDAGEE